VVSSPLEILEESRRGGYDLVLIDLNYTRDTTSGREGLELIEQIHALQPSAPVVVMTAWGSIEVAVEAMRRGAVDFVTKPWDNVALLATVEKHAGQARRHGSELEIAARVQRNLFPREATRMGSIECAGTCVPAREVGGDYFDFLDGSWLVLADVSGKGMGAALLMANLQALFRSRSEPGMGARLYEVNRLLHRSTSAENYATAFYASWDERSRTLHYVNCGHPAALVVRETGEVERLSSTATVLGMFPSWRCEEGAVRLGNGDVVVAYSDGVTETRDATGEEFGESRAATLVTAYRHRTAGEIASALAAAVRQHGGGAAEDDISVIALKAGL
jgi:sigma-B regulation protein RsbU (phosphoserine phosphatase)